MVFDVLLAEAVIEQYILFKPIHGISKHDQQIATIPAGAFLVVVLRPSRVGVAEALWEGQSITVLYQDVESNGRLVPQAEAAPEQDDCTGVTASSSADVLGADV